MPDISDLKDEENDPVDRGDERIQGECGVVKVILSPYRTARITSIFRTADRIIDSADKKEQPTGECEDLVEQDCSSVVCFASGERIDSVCVNHVGWRMVSELWLTASYVSLGEAAKT